MLTWLKSLFQSPSAPANLAPAPVETPDLSHSAELQSLRLELTERDKTIATLKQDLEQQRQKEYSRLETAGQGEIENLLSQLASPISQLLTQTYLMEEEGKTVQAKDILTVTKQLIRTLEAQGLTIAVPVGQQVPFDPNYHQPREFQESNERHQLRSSSMLPLTLNLANIAMVISTMWADLETTFVRR
jgi:molecular chaperone GrpE (heat shock protein)